MRCKSTPAHFKTTLRSGCDGWTYASRSTTVERKKRKYHTVRRCKICGKPFDAQHSKQTCCSVECSEKDQQSRADPFALESGDVLTCGICGKTFVRNLHALTYCSDECRAEARKRRSWCYRHMGQIADGCERHVVRRKKAKEKKNLSLIEAAAQAKALGISYGQWQQRQNGFCGQ